MQVSGKLLQTVGTQVQYFELLAAVEVPNAFELQLVVGKIQNFQVCEVLLAQHWYPLDVVELQIQLAQVPQVAQLLKPYLVIRQIQRRQVLEVAEILFDDIDDLLG